jgi:hypothetical protein
MRKNVAVLLGLMVTVFLLPALTYAVSADQCDFNDDNDIDWKDLSVITRNWLLDCSTHDCNGADLDSSGSVNLVDFTLFAEYWNPDANLACLLMACHCLADRGQEKLYLWQSNDGIDWKLLNGGPSYSAPEYVIRDPSIFKHTDGKYYICYTNNNISPQNFTGTRFGVASSPDLVVWTHVCWVDFGSVSYVWAPEWFIDTDGSVHIFVAVDYIIKEVHPTNSTFTAWSSPVTITGTNFPQKMIDPFIIYRDGTYYLWYVNDHGVAGADSTIEYASSSSLTSGYTVIESGDWAGWGHPREGESLVHLGGSNWRIYLQTQLGAMYWSESYDNWQTWTGKVLLTDDQPDLVIGHGTVIHSQ